MGFRFRKSIGKGPFRVNVSKSGVGYSVGTKGFRVTKKATGGMRTTASIPGTGISYVSDSGSSKSKIASSHSSAYSSPRTSSGSRNNSMPGYCNNCYRKIGIAAVCPACGTPNTAEEAPARKPLYKRCWFLLIAGILCLRACGAIIGAKPEETVPTDVPTITQEAEAVAQDAEESRPADAINVSDIFASQGSNASTDAPYIINTGTKVFHEAGCGYAEEITESNREGSHASRQDLVQDGYEPCGHCNP